SDTPTLAPRASEYSTPRPNGSWSLSSRTSTPCAAADLGAVGATYRRIPTCRCSRHCNHRSCQLAEQGCTTPITPGNEPLSRATTASHTARRVFRLLWVVQAGGQPDADSEQDMDYLMQLLSDPTAWLALATLIAMEVVLGIDNLIFISILTNKLPPHQRTRGRRIGIGLALFLRLALLGTVAWIVQLTEPVFTILGNEFSWKDIILISGGLFLIWKATKEIHHSVDPDPEGDMFEGKPAAQAAQITFSAAIFQILLLDLVFSIDS